MKVVEHKGWLPLLPMLKEDKVRKDIDSQCKIDMFKEDDELH